MFSPSPRHDPAEDRAERTLAARAAEGDAQAFELIMRRHNRLLFRTARGIVRDDAEAQDVVQETYLRAFSRLGSFRGDAALGTWLARIAINVALDVQRKGGRIVQLDEPIEPNPSEPSAEIPMSLPASASLAPDQAAERSQLGALLQAAIGALPEIYRSVFMLRAVEELSVLETASVLQVSGDVVKTRYLRARSMLRDSLGAQIEAQAPLAFAFAGARCDAVVAQVLAELGRRGLIRPSR